jgi:hypothetical protein
VFSANLVLSEGLRPAPVILIAGLTLMIIGEVLALIRHAGGSLPVLASPRSGE